MTVYLITRKTFDGTFEHCFDENEKVEALKFIQFCMKHHIDITMQAITDRDWQYWENFE